MHVAVAATLSLLVLGSSASAADIRRVGPKANGSSIMIPLDTILVVSLPGNATTGYSWRVRLVNRDILKPLSVRYMPKKPLPGHVGGGGTYVLRFQAISYGMTRLRLVYALAGANASPTKTFTLRVRVPERI
jgi:predicted secreted protein